MHNAAASVGDDSAAIDNNAVGRKYGYRLGYNDGDYQIEGAIFNSVEDRKINVFTIGASVSSILIAYLIQTQAQRRRTLLDIGRPGLHCISVVSCIVLQRPYLPSFDVTNAFGIVFAISLVVIDHHGDQAHSLIEQRDEYLQTLR